MDLPADLPPEWGIDVDEWLCGLGPDLAGLAFVRHAAEETTLPWFAIGGIAPENLGDVLEAEQIAGRLARIC